MLSLVVRFRELMKHRFRKVALTLALCACAPGPALAASSAEDPAPTNAADSSWFDEPAPLDSPEPAPGPGPEPAAAAAAPSAAAASETDPRALTTFRPALDPYGYWVSDPRYGTVWVPNRDAVGADFAPYVSRGRWALTNDDDWTWQSDYPFGWAVFHYGRWVWIGGGSGWAWVPGTTYANAWVVWRVPSGSYAYVGWAPMPPTWVWMNGSAISLWYAPPLPYVFCPSAYAFDRHVHRHIVRDRGLMDRIAAHSRAYPGPYHAPAAPRVASRTTSSRAIGARALSPRAPAPARVGVPSRALPRERVLVTARLPNPTVSRTIRDSTWQSRVTPRSDGDPRRDPTPRAEPLPRSALAPRVQAERSPAVTPSSERPRTSASPLPRTDFDRRRGEPSSVPRPARSEDARAAPRPRLPAESRPTMRMEPRRERASMPSPASHGRRRP